MNNIRNLAMKTEEIIKQIEEKLRNEDISEVFALWTIIAEHYGSWQRMKQEMGEVQTKKLATLFDKFSAVYSEQGIEPEICEGMSVIANGLRLGCDPP